jgi:hypothetical protein
MDLWCKCFLYRISMRILERVLPVNRVLVAGQWPGLAQAGPAPQFGPGGNADTALFLSQGIAVLPGGGAEAGSGSELRG